jgi:ATP-binding protein involved in chromosome partitioning
MLQRDEIIERLKQIKFPGFSEDIVTLGLVKDIRLTPKKITMVLDMRTKDTNIQSAIEQEIKLSIPEVPVEIKYGQPTPAAQPAATDLLVGVKRKIAIASGKGGVGKSTITVNLAAALAQRNLKVGLLDADIYGPSIPLMLGITEKPVMEGNLLQPIEKYNIKLMSLGFLIDRDNPVIWRGPLVMRALQQLMADVAWGTLDIMLFDMPPGTGDAQLTLSQSIRLDGAVIVSTPQEVALIDAIKGVQMFRKVNVPIMGIIENMSYFICPHCSKQSNIFATGGVRKAGKRLGVEVMGEIPIDLSLREGGDEGIPIVLKSSENAASQIFNNIAASLQKKLQI